MGKNCKYRKSINKRKNYKKTTFQVYKNDRKFL